VDRVLRLENIVKAQSPPAELHSLKSTNSFAFPTSGGEGDLRERIHKLDLVGEGVRAWNIDGGHKIIRGLPVSKFIRHRPIDITRASPTLPLPPPRRPDWADLIYHPAMSPGVIRPTIRRINGNRLRPFYIFGNDARQPFFPTGYPLQCIGRMFAYADPYSFNWSWSGTGALVGPSTVLTASHVVPWNSNPAMIQFVPAYFNGQSTLGPNVYSYVSGASAYYQEPSPEPDRAAWDFAVLQLIDPLGDSLGWFGTKTYDDGWNDDNYWELVGYAGAIANAEQPFSQGGIDFHDDDTDGDAYGIGNQ
jgi:hypothetical protein